MSTATLIEFAAHYDLDPAAPETLADYREYCEKLALLEAVMAEAFEEVQTEPLTAARAVVVTASPGVTEDVARERVEHVLCRDGHTQLVLASPKQQRAYLVLTALHLLDSALGTPDVEGADALRDEAWGLLDQAVALFSDAASPALQQGASA